MAQHAEPAATLLGARARAPAAAMLVVGALKRALGHCIPAFSAPRRFSAGIMAQRSESVLTLLEALALAPAAAALIVGALKRAEDLGLAEDRKALRLAHSQLRDAVDEATNWLEALRRRRSRAPADGAPLAAPRGADNARHRRGGPRGARV
jgi:hypothetical protein